MIFRKSGTWKLEHCTDCINMRPETLL